MIDAASTALQRARRGFLLGLKALARGDTCSHAVEVLIRVAIALGDAAKACKAAGRRLDNAIKRVVQATPAHRSQECVKLASPLVSRRARR